MLWEMLGLSVMCDVGQKEPAYKSGGESWSPHSEAYK